MFHFDNSFNYPIKTLQDDPNIYTFPEDNYLFTQENLKNTQYDITHVPNPLPLNPSYTEQKSKQQPNSNPTKPCRSHLKKKHVVSKAERRAEHNAIERARRECLNSKFQKLADALPNLRSHRRPSKGQIVEKALDWVKQNMTMENRYQYQIMQLQNENKRLISQMTQENTNNNTSPLYIAVDYTHSHSLQQQQVQLSFDNTIPVSPTSTDGSNFTTGTTTDDQLPMIKNHIDDTAIEYDLPLSTVTDEDDSDIKSTDENVSELNSPNYCFFGYQNVDISAQDRAYQGHQYDMNYAMVKTDSIGFPTSFVE